MSNEELKALIRQTVKEVLDEENPVYKDLKDVPEYWKGAAAALLDSAWLLLPSAAVTTRSSFPSFRRSAATPRPLRAVCRHRSAT